MTEPPEETQAAAAEPAPEPVAEPADPAAPPAEPSREAPHPEPSSPQPSSPIALPPTGRRGSKAETPVAELAPASRRPLVKRHHGLVRLTHWANALLLVSMIGSGLQIYMAFPHFGPRGGPYFPNPWDGKPFPLSMRLGGWLASGLNWHFALAWPFVLTGLLYLGYLVFTGEWRSLLFRLRDIPRAWQMQLYYLRLRKEHPPQGKHNALQKLAYTSILLLGILSVLTGFAVYKPTELSWLTALFGGYQLARYWHFWAVWIFVAFTLVHVTLVLVVDPASLRAMITGWYRGRFPSHD
ncbi:MAG TPA: cytochrome b/b6 domain-containing protein [Gemmatimonadales bacterium]|nr:cytochrome b/b6 domain-containing protein [Gemmatimonadales bacterium]